MSQFFQSRPVLYIRAMLFMSGFVSSTIIFALLLIVTVVLPLMYRYQLVRVYAWLCLRWLQLCCGLRYRIEGWDNLPDKPAVIFAKHQSTLETLIMVLHLPASVFVAKRELLYVPFFGWGMAVLKYIAINRGSGRKAVEQMIVQAKDRLALGLWIIVFPEGTRRAVDAPPQYKMGGAVMAAETGAPVVPIALNSGVYWPRHSLIKWPGEMVFSIGPTIESIGKTPEQVRAAAKLWIENDMARLLGKTP